MKIEQRREGPAMVVSPVGRLDAVGAPDLEACILAIAARGNSRVVLDCARMTYISSGGLRAVLICAKTCRQLGGGLAVAALRPECRSVLEISGLLSFLDCHERVDAALAAPQRTGRTVPSGARTQPAPGDGLPMEIEEHREPEHSAVAVSLNGRLIGTAASVLEAWVRALVERGEARVVLDCERLSYINSAGLRALLICARTCRREGGEFVLAALRPECRVVVSMSGFLSFIDLHETREAALAALVAPLPKDIGSR